LQILDQGRPWPQDGRPRLAGISSFGFGGTNAHLIVGDWGVEPQDQDAAGAPTPVSEPVAAETVDLLPLSAKSETALQALAARYAAFLRENDGVSGRRAYLRTRPPARSPSSSRVRAPSIRTWPAASTKASPFSGRR